MVALAAVRGRQLGRPSLVGVGHHLHLQAGQVGDRRGEERAEPAGAGQAESEGARHVWSSRATPILESAMP